MRGIAAYQENHTTTQSKGRLVVLLYEGAVKFLRQSIQALEAGDLGEKGKFINKAIAIIEELNYCLDMEAGGEIASNLRALYLFMIKHLDQANIKRDPKMVQEVIKILEDLNEGWKQITA
ncbi:MAG: flagellar export chaperone FliS [Phycisphaerae bacterium]